MIVDLSFLDIHSSETSLSPCYSSIQTVNRRITLCFFQLELVLVVPGIQKSESKKGKIEGVIWQG
jgi:hypothetical protein